MQPIFAFELVDVSDSMIEAREVFTRGEIQEIFGEIVSIVDPNSMDIDLDTQRHILCRCGPVSFLAALPTIGPFYSHVILIALHWIETNPFEFINRFNTGAHTARAYVQLEDDGTIQVDSDGQFEVKAEVIIPFAGLVTPEHLQFVLRMWIEDLFDFLEIEQDDDQEEPSLDIRTDSPVSVLERITEILTNFESRTARQLSRDICVPKHEINHTLYNSLDLFGHDGGQPPRWSLR